ncbi:MAG: twitch domain-containing radical SAM protein [Pseudobdellovibrionaceae bacterium]
MFCTNPFNHIDIIVENEHVYIKPCNVWSKQMSLAQYKKNIKNIQNILKTTFHNRCGVCIDKEKYGARSRRQAVNQFHKDNRLMLDKIQSLGLRYGTLCNSKCIICSHVRSSSWVSDSIELGVEVEPRFLFKKNKMPGIDFLFDEFDLSDLKYVEFHGGEPLLQTYPLEFLKKIKNLGQLVVKFNTNLTVLPSQQLQEILKECKRVDFLISVDDIEERYEILRYPAKWNDFEHNLKYMKTLQYRLIAFNVISTLNLWYLPEFYHWAIRNFGNNVHSQFVDPSFFLDPKIADISYLNNKAKEKFLNKIEGVNSKLYHSIRNKLSENKAINFDVVRLENYLKKLDKIRSTDYFSSFSEWWKIIKE